MLENFAKERAGLRLHQRILGVRLGGIDVAVGRNDIVIPCQDDRHAGGIEIGGMRHKSLQPGELVVEFRPRLRIAVWPIERCDEHAVDRSLDIAALFVSRISG